MLHYVLDETTEEVQYPVESFFIQDGNALFYALTNLPPTFGDMCLMILDQMLAKKNFIFSTDSYHVDSIKSQERVRRGMSPKFLLDGPSTQRPADLKFFLGNDENKVQLCRLMLKIWSSTKGVSRLEKCQTACLVVEGKSYKLETSDGEVIAHSYVYF